MNWEAIGALGEILGALAVVGTLGYLAAQMKTNTAAVNQASRQATLLGRAEATRWLSGDAEISKLFWLGSSAPKDLSEDEWDRYLFVVGSIIRPIELAYIDLEEGRMSEELWEGQRQTILFWMPKPGWQKFLEEYGQTLYPPFKKYVLAQIAT